MHTTLSLVQQQRIIANRYPKAKIWFPKKHRGEVLWADLKLQVSPIYEAYRVLIGYKLGVQPKVFVDSPEPVKQAHGIRTPHLNYDDSLCLYDPGKGQWADTDAIAHTTMPWTLRWLFHYENWLVTGVWLGDTIAPVTKDDAPPSLPGLEKPQ